MPRRRQGADDRQSLQARLLLHLAKGGGGHLLAFFDMAFGQVGDAVAHDADELAVFYNDAARCRRHPEGLFKG